MGYLKGCTKETQRLFFNDEKSFLGFDFLPSAKPQKVISRLVNYVNESDTGKVASVCHFHTIMGQIVAVYIYHSFLSKKKSKVVKFPNFTVDKNYPK